MRKLVIVPLASLVIQSLTAANQVHHLDKERIQGMDIALVPVGKLEFEIIETLKSDLGSTLGMGVDVVKEMAEPEYAYEKKRGQHYSTAIINVLMKHERYGSYHRLLGVIDHDLYFPGLNFVFGEARGKAALISVTRLRQEYYSRPRDLELFHRRILVEAVHELGHTFGLVHCSDPGCVMFFSNSLMDTDRKGSEYCPVCRKKLNSAKWK